MTAFESGIAASSWPMLVAQHGSAVTYTPNPADPGTYTELTALVGQASGEEVEGEDGRYLRRSRSVVISTDTTAASGGIEEPSLEAEVTIGGETWAVEAIESLGTTIARLRVVLSASVEKARPGRRVVRF